MPPVRSASSAPSPPRGAAFTVPMSWKAVGAGSSRKSTIARNLTVSPPRQTVSRRLPWQARVSLRPFARGKAGKKLFWCSNTWTCAETEISRRWGARSPAYIRSAASTTAGLRNNYIGATPQLNRRSSSWNDFWREARLMPQLELARKNGLGKALSRKGEQLAAALPQLLAGHAPSASLLHGDLWSGNAGFLAQGAPVLFDPAVYRGDREADISMTELFGGFPQAFYSAYQEVAPLDQDYAVRTT